MRIAAIALSALLGAALAPTAATAQTKCDLDRPIVFAGLDYDSAQLHTALAMRILETGYGCKVDSVPGQPLPLLAGLARGDLDVVMEVWSANPAQAWVDAEKAGKVVAVGSNFPDAREAWFVPRYLVEGADAKAAGLKSVRDLPKFKQLFADPEEPGKGRFYNCIAGWRCEVVNSKKLIAYGLDKDFTNFRPGTGEALAATIESAVKRQRPIVFYYWGPTWLLGKYDFVQLEEPPYDKAVFDAMVQAERPDKATAFPISDVLIGANKEFAGQAPTIVKFLDAYATTNALVSEALAYMRDNEADPKKAAVWFLKEKPELWSKWVPADVAERVKAKL